MGPSLDHLAEINALKSQLSGVEGTLGVARAEVEAKKSKIEELEENFRVEKGGLVGQLRDLEVERGEEVFRLGK